MTTDFEYTLSEIEDNARALVSLCGDPHPGLTTWLEAVGARLERLAELRVVQRAPWTELPNPTNRARGPGA